MPASVFAPLLTPLRRYAAPDVPPLVVGVSGGADSVALLRALLMLGIKPVVAHLDHQLRPESERDAEWVRQLCAGLGAEYVTQTAPVARVAAERGWTTEEAARRLRYAFLARTAKQRGAQLILTAHTQNDQAETVLWQLLRGEAVLSGIASERGPLHRPWLGVSRAQLTAALSEWQQPWLEDASNADTRYTRNWLRAEVLPLLRSRFSALDASLSRLARFQAQDDDALQAASRFSSHAPQRGQPPALLRRAVRRELQAAGLTFHAEHLEQLAAALSAGDTQHLTLPGGRAASVTGGPFPTLQLPNSLQPWPQPSFTPPPSWTLRHRQTADRMRLEGGTRKLSDILTDLKVPRAERGAVWLLADEDGVQWLGTLPPLWAQGAREQVQVLDPADFAPDSDPDTYFMGEALELARAAAEAGEVPVGAVVVSGGATIARAANRSRELGDMTRHAELDALRLAAQVVGPYLTACTLYVTLEPCPMCLGAMLEARLGRVVYAASNPRAGALGGVCDVLAQTWGHTLAVTPGVRASQAARLLKTSFREFRSARSPK
ncbi:tRNA lysidine(34) synthetase TilS [Deinococcus psychrotolerans]|uniref:Multifunctional fusion protein n=1 Tax=Deinococcus psychrotolerans TaxID=2489213 RepID=A0A3G8YM61_9DEIO|nr:tRNA lysidine(34) synthetase TilS [Deinococcus psychrotolerans]AZI42236.1 tRNA lysidine(34) synthetase TilS [Deinococcus psychrotolerans]